MGIKTSDNRGRRRSVLSLKYIWRYYAARLWRGEGESIEEARGRI